MADEADQPDAPPAMAEHPPITEPAEEPVTVEPVEEVVAEPVEEPVVADEPVEEPVIAEPAEEQVVAEPVEEPAVADPVEEPVVDEPVEEPAMAEPVEEAVVDEPVEEPVVAESVEEPVEAEPVKEPVVAEPVEEPVTDEHSTVETVEPDNIVPAEETATAELVQSDEQAVHEPSVDEPVTEPPVGDETEHTAEKGRMSESKVPRVHEELAVNETADHDSVLSGDQNVATEGQEAHEVKEGEGVEAEVHSEETIISVIEPDMMEDLHELEEMEAKSDQPCPDMSKLTIPNSDSLFNSLKNLQDFVGSKGDKITQSDIMHVNHIVIKMKTDMKCLKEFCENTQSRMERVRQPLKEMAEHIVSSIKADDITVSSEGKSHDELEIDLRQRQMESHLAEINSALLQSSKLVAQTEYATMKANQAITEAVETARRAQKDLEERRKKEEEEKRAAEELEKLMELKRIEEERLAQESKLLEAKLKEEAKRAGMSEGMISCTLEIESEQDFDAGIGCIVHFYPESLSEDMFKCTVLNPFLVDLEYHSREELISNIIEVSPSDTNPNKTLAGIINIDIPHCLTKKQAVLRQPIVRMEVVESKYVSTWKEVETKEVALEGRKDINIVRAVAIKSFGRFAVMSRLRKDKVKMRKRGGTVGTQLDDKIKFTSDEDSFPTKERMILQIQPVDQLALYELRKRLDCAKGLLCTTSYYRFEWTNRSFQSSIFMTMPIPPNPVTYRKMMGIPADKARGDGLPPGMDDDREEEDAGKGAAHGEEGPHGKEGAEGEEGGEEEGHKEDGGTADDTSVVDERESATMIASEHTAEEGAKEAEKVAAEAPKAVEEEVVKEEAAAEGEEGDEKKKDEEPSKKKQLKKKNKGELSEEMKALWKRPVNWYMGQYGKETDEDERDQIMVLMYDETKAKWSIENYQVEIQKKGDTVRVESPEPVKALVVFRMTLAAKEKEAEQIAEELDNVLNSKLVTFILKQSLSDPCEVRACVVPLLKKNRVERQLIAADFGGPKPSAPFTVCEGDQLCLTFRGNVKCLSDSNQLTVIYNSNIDTTFKLQVGESDIYLQKSYEVYRGFVQLKKVIATLLERPEEEEVAEGEKTEKGEKESEGDESDLSSAPSEMPRMSRRGTVTTEEIMTAVELQTQKTSVERIVPEEFIRRNSNTEAEPTSVSDLDATTDEAESKKTSSASSAAPLYDIQLETLSELLITFPKNYLLLKAKPPIKAAITYRPDGDPVNLHVLRKLCHRLHTDDKWLELLRQLGLDHHMVDAVSQYYELKKSKPDEIRFQILMQWVKRLEKSEMKLEMMERALNNTGQQEVAMWLRNLAEGHHHGKEEHEGEAAGSEVEDKRKSSARHASIKEDGKRRTHVEIEEEEEGEEGHKHTEGHEEGHKEGHEDGHEDEHGEGHEEGHADEDGESHAEGHEEGHTDEHGEGHAKGHEEGQAEEHGEGHAEGHEPGQADEHAEGHEEGQAEEHTEGHAEEHTEGQAEEHGDASAETHGEEHTEGHEHTEEHAESRVEGHAEEHAEEQAEVQEEKIEVQEEEKAEVQEQEQAEVQEEEPAEEH